ncbi:hypothetical protein O181_052005 [Austropuccinia psidii MF-1]|uniref:Uncharacterized protein n=1 Tax=Austropuccinia psidii MF-1 TaxID=1389203 RepID=A0A9Q3HS97_9BASI|nr:hypothetical protein [Austropuccinia psidii MF-1]
MDSPAANTPDIQRILMSIMKAQYFLTSTMSSPKVTSTIPNQKTKESFQQNKNNQNPLKPKSNHKSGFQRAQSEPAALNTPPKKLPSLHPKQSPKGLNTLTNKTPKHNPLQMQETNSPPDFKGVKVSLWDLKEKGSIPVPPTQNSLANFYHRFSNINQLDEVVQDCGGVNLADEDDIQEFARQKLQPVKLARGLQKISQTYINYIQDVLGRLGFSRWAPNLAQNHDYLYNVSCWIAAISTFQQLSAGGAYNNYNMNFSFITRTGLLQKAYDHYVHYHMKEVWEKEMKNPGHYQAQASKHSSNKNQAWLRDARLDFAILQKFPQRYHKIIEENAAHSDDEADEQKPEIYVIHTLRYRSRKANILFWRLDQAMDKYQRNMGLSSRMRVPVLPKIPIQSENCKPPKGLPADFYSLKWFKGLTNMEKRMTVDIKNVAFLLNTEESLNPKKHPDESLSDKVFNKKYRDEVTKSYVIEEESVNEEVEDGNETIDLEAPSPDQSEAEDGWYYEPGEYSYEDDEEDEEETEEVAEAESDESNEKAKMEGIEEG